MNDTFLGSWFLVHFREIRPYGSSTPSLANPRQPVVVPMRLAGSRCLHRRRQREKKGTVRIVSHLPAVTATTHAGRHRPVGKLASCTSAVVNIVGPAWERWTIPRLRAPGPSSRVGSPGAHALMAKHQRFSRRRRTGPPRGIVTTVGFAVAAAPWTLVFFSPISAGAQPPSLASQATTSITQPQYAPLLVAPLDSGGTTLAGNGGVFGAGAGVTSLPLSDA